MRKLYLTYEQIADRINLGIDIKNFKAANDRYMKAMLYDIRFLKAIGVDWFQTETPPSMPGMPVTDETIEEEQTL